MDPDRFTTLPPEILLEIANYVDEEGGSFEFPCLATLALSRTCKALNALLEPFLQRPHLGNDLLDIPSDNHDDQQTAHLCRDRKLEFEAYASPDVYFHSVRWLQLDFSQGGASQRFWQALGEYQPDDDQPLIPLCNDCDFITNKLVQHLQGPAPLQRLTGLSLGLPNSDEIDFLQSSVDIIGKLFRCPKLRFLNVIDVLSVSSSEVYMPKVPEHLIVSLDVGGFEDPFRITTYYDLVPHPVSIQVELFDTHGWPTGWHKSIRRIHLHGGDDANQFLAFLEEVVEIDQFRTNGLYLDEDICKTIARSGCWAMVIDFDTKSLTFDFDEPSHGDGHRHEEDDSNHEEAREEQEVFRITELSPRILQIMPDVQILRLRLGDPSRENVKKSGMNDADITALTQHLGSLRSLRKLEVDLEYPYNFSVKRRSVWLEGDAKMIAQAAPPSLSEVTLSYLSHAPVQEENYELDRIISSWKVSRYGDSLWLDKIDVTPYL